MYTVSGMRCMLPLPDSFVAYDQFTARHLNSNESGRLSTFHGRVSGHGLVCTCVEGLPEHIRRLLHTSSQMDSLDVNQLLDLAGAILKDDTPAAELIVVAAKTEQQDTDLSSTNDLQSDIVSHRCGDANHIARHCLS